jgi:hypothetical protein
MPFVSTPVPPASQTSSPNRAPSNHTHPLFQLPEEDLDFVLQFVLASGSLKEMAQRYGVSYPTIRATLDRVILAIQAKVNKIPPDPMTDLLASLVERGEIKAGAARSIRAVYRQALEKDPAKETNPWPVTFSKEFA